MSVTIECDWCHTHTGPWHSLRFLPDEALDVAAAWLEHRDVRPWVTLPGPPGIEFHLCAGCAQSGPPRRLPPPKRKKAGA